MRDPRYVHIPDDENKKVGLRIYSGGWSTLFALRRGLAHYDVHVSRELHS